jgi:hypothetical protein
VNIAAQAVQLGNSYGTTASAGFRKCGDKLGTVGQSVGAFARFDLDEDTDKLEALSGCEALQGFSLGVQAKT